VKVWKVAPGRNAAVWTECLDDGVTTINWLDDFDLSKFASKSDVTNRLKELKEGSSGGANSIWSFVHSILPGHIIVANNGLSQVVGIGVCKSSYLSPNNKSNPRRKSGYHLHARLVDWIINENFELPNRLFNQPTVQELTELQTGSILAALRKKSVKAANAVRKSHSSGTTKRARP
jgi:predicted Mrr-cat superfamily restriction endonuclease